MLHTLKFAKTVKVLTYCLSEAINYTKSNIRHANAGSLSYTQYISSCNKLKIPLFKSCYFL